MSNKAISTERYNISHGKFIKLLLQLVGRRWLWFPAILFVVVSLFAVLSDLRYAIVAMMVLFILIPMLLAFLYIYYGLSQGCWQNILERRLTVSDDFVEIVSYVKRKIGFDDEETLREEERITKIEWKDINRVRFISSGIVLELSCRPYGFMYIPFSAIPDKEESKKMIELILERFNRNAH